MSYNKLLCIVLGIQSVTSSRSDLDRRYRDKDTQLSPEVGSLRQVCKDYLLVLEQSPSLNGGEDKLIKVCSACLERDGSDLVMKLEAYGDDLTCKVLRDFIRFMISPDGLVGLAPASFVDRFNRLFENKCPDSRAVKAHLSFRVDHPFGLALSEDFVNYAQKMFDSLISRKDKLTFRELEIKLSELSDQIQHAIYYRYSLSTPNSELLDRLLKLAEDVNSLLKREIPGETVSYTGAGWMNALVDKKDGYWRHIHTGSKISYLADSELERSKPHPLSLFKRFAEIAYLEYASIEEELDADDFSTADLNGLGHRLSDLKHRIEESLQGLKGEQASLAIKFLAKVNLLLEKVRFLEEFSDIQFAFERHPPKNEEELESFQISLQSLHQKIRQFLDGNSDDKLGALLHQIYLLYIEIGETVLPDFSVNLGELSNTSVSAAETQVGRLRRLFATKVRYIDLDVLLTALKEIDASIQSIFKRLETSSEPDEATWQLLDRLIDLGLSDFIADVETRIAEVKSAPLRPITI